MSRNSRDPGDTYPGQPTELETGVAPTLDPAHQPTLSPAHARTLDPAHAPTMDSSPTTGKQLRVALADTMQPTDPAAVSSDLALLAPPGQLPNSLAQWERYETLRPLGQGGMGTVFLAKDRKLGRLVALKFLRTPSADAAERLAREARAQARLDHNNICKVFEVGEFQGQPYIAMEYIDGKPLYQVIRQLTLEQKIIVLSQLALAVQSAHSQGILHRDLKPANVMICDAKGDPTAPGGLRPVLMDFGLARDSLGPQRMTQTGVIMGTFLTITTLRNRSEGNGNTDTDNGVRIGALSDGRQNQVDLVRNLT